MNSSCGRIFARAGTLRTPVGSILFQFAALGRTRGGPIINRLIYWELFVGWSLSTPGPQSAHLLVQLFIGNLLFHQNVSTLRVGGRKAPANDKMSINNSINNGAGGVPFATVALASRRGVRAPSLSRRARR